LQYEHQYGFQRNKSTQQNLTILTNYIYSALNDKKFCIGVFLDLRKAFDVCSHTILLKKLRKYGIHGKTLEWFASYLQDRKQKVDINGHLYSDLTFNISGYPGEHSWTYPVSNLYK
jgi:methylaspartate ammonia-lyase